MLEDMARLRGSGGAAEWRGLAVVVCLVLASLCVGARGIGVLKPGQEPKFSVVFLDDDEAVATEPEVRRHSAARF